MINYWCDDEITKKDFITTCATQFKTEFSQLFGDIFARSYCSVIRTSILEVALALTSAGLPLNGFNFDKVGLKAASAEAATVHDGENLIKTSEWNPWYKQEFEGGKSCQIIALLNVNTAIWQVFELVENRTAWWEIGLFWRVFHHRVVEAAKDFGDATITASAASKKKTSIAIWRPLEAKVHSQLQLKLLLSTSDDVIDDLNGKSSSISSQCDILPFLFFMTYEEKQSFIEYFFFFWI